ncbi:MAG: DUF2461 domain-containing protein [Rhodospirillales bacterium]
MAKFAGFPPATFAFLKGLAAHNDRVWFTANKASYEKSVLAPFHLLLADVVAALAEKGIPLAGDPKKAIFRIYRDVRFSKEKLPYKTHAGAVLTRDGVKGASGILYIHIDPEGCWLAAGFHAPDPEQLGAIREAIYIDPPRFQTVREELAAVGLVLDTSQTLSRMPRDYQDAADGPVADALRLKRFVVRRPLTVETVSGTGLIAEAVSFAADTEPLLRFGWQALTVLDPTALKN